MSVSRDLESNVETRSEKPLMGSLNIEDAPSKRIRTLGTQIIDAACIILNVVSTVLLVFLNKW